MPKIAQLVQVLTTKILLVSKNSNRFGIFINSHVIVLSRCLFYHFCFDYVCFLPNLAVECFVAAFLSMFGKVPKAETSTLGHEIAPRPS